MQPASSEDDRRKEIHRRSIARDRIENRLGRQNRTPSPVAGRSHIDIQTDLYLEELADVIPEADISTQTDSFLDRPASPIFIPKKSGDDVATQIEQGDLFDFDIEVQPLLDIIVGKTLEQAIFEVLEERELAALKSQQVRATSQTLRCLDLFSIPLFSAFTKRNVRRSWRKACVWKLQRNVATKKRYALDCYRRLMLNNLTLRRLGTSSERSRTPTARKAAGGREGCSSSIRTGLPQRRGPKCFRDNGRTWIVLR